ncbi:hypothetical protein RCG17_20050 [Neobacillus sp. PS3-12]|uniref:rolling circle replication-associated protein n=1 Tax=Neobacillus sp. PS3-12 TaxID=3070677 RepID=UPI0027DFF487|nr:hypothetical protein [Neobacillus sp. PS3-12]WML51706.1 hypothetical protein RCG17_20050 [Neobacillus sp. PS3-12]
MNKSYTKVILSGRLMEVSQQSTPPLVSRKSLGGRKPYGSVDKMIHDTNKKISINRARAEIKRLLECNFPKQYAFLTLTFRPSKEHDITDLEACYKQFCDFKKRLNYYLEKKQLPPFKYIGVTEFQGSGAVHYHFVCDLIKIPLHDLEMLWDFGWINRKVIKSNPTTNKKIIYYLNKGIMDERLTGKKKYLRSHGLKKPLSIIINNLEDFYEHINSCNIKELESGSYHSKLYGEILYHNYYVENVKEIMDYVQGL